MRFRRIWEQRKAEFATSFPSLFSAENGAGREKPRTATGSKSRPKQLPMAANEPGCCSHVVRNF